jgi:hypothetical protein
MLKIYTGAALTGSILDSTDNISASIAYSACTQPSGSPHGRDVRNHPGRDLEKQSLTRIKGIEAG